jgi:hypothetical protein
VEAGQGFGFIHNLFLWDGSIVDEDGFDLNFEYSYGHYVIVMEPQTEHVKRYKSFLAFGVNPYLPPESMHQFMFGDLVLARYADPVDLLNGSFLCGNIPTSS